MQVSLLGFFPGFGPPSLFSLSHGSLTVAFCLATRRCMNYLTGRRMLMTLEWVDFMAISEFTLVSIAPASKEVDLYPT